MALRLAGKQNSSMCVAFLECKHTQHNCLIDLLPISVQKLELCFKMTFGPKGLFFSLCLCLL